MSRITGGEKPAEDGKDNGAAGSTPADAKPADAEEKAKKGVPELQASLPPVATR